MKQVVLYITLLMVLVGGCTTDIDDSPRPNQPPKTFLWLFPDSTIAKGPSRQHLRWWGEDPDGIVKGYLIASDTIKFYDSLYQVIPTATATWRWRTLNDTLMAFPLLKKEQTFYVAVRAVDNTISFALPDQAVVRFSPSPYWDKNENGAFDTEDQLLEFPPNAIDPTAATLDMPLLNQPPSVVFAPNPNDPSVTMLQPETTYTAATFAWVGSDPDGDKTIESYRIALNDPTDSSRWVTVQSTVTMVTLHVPRSRSDGDSGEVEADLYSGKYLSRQYIGTIRGLKLDSLNTFYLQARDVAGDFSPIIRMPEVGKRWFVRKPQSKLLAVIDYINSDSTSAQQRYDAALANIMLPSGSLANYDRINIGRGISTNDKKDAAKGSANPRFGVLVPPFIDPAFIYTLFLYDYVFWYTDQYPSIPVAQSSLFQYYNTVFDGRKGKVIFSTSFESNPDPRSLLRDFAPIDSISTVDLSSVDVRLPRFGDSRVPGGFQLVPDSSDILDVYPVMTFGTGIHSVYLRPIFRRSDARYIYHMQDDTRNPFRYAYSATLSELKSITTAGTTAWICGTGGKILTSSDGGQNWIEQRSGVSISLNAIQFINASDGWITGEDGTVLKTIDGGATWVSRSALTFQDLLGLHAFSTTTVVAVGTSGIIIRTTDGGSSWNSPRSNTNKNLRSVHFTDASNGIAVGDTIILKSTDGGDTWQSIRNIPQRQYNAVRYIEASTVIAAGSGGAVVRSGDGGDTWTSQAVLGGELRSVDFIDGLNGWTCGRSGALYRTNDGGATWANLSSATGVSQHLNGIRFIDPSNGWCVGSGGIILRTQDGGTSWTTQPKGVLNVAVIDGAKSFVFVGLPLHLLNGDGTNVELFFRHVLLNEFGY